MQRDTKIGRKQTDRHADIVTDRHAKRHIDSPGNRWKKQTD